MPLRLPPPHLPHLPWLEPVRRERARSFALFLWHRFLDDRCFESAGALAYASVFALVPLTAALFGVVSAVPAFEDWLNTLTRFVFANFVPEAARAVEEYLLDFAGSARGLTSIGGAVLLGTALLTMKAVEDTFNRIWRVKTPRPGLARFLVYWTVLTLGPLMILGGLALSSYFISLPMVSHTAEEIGFGGRLLRLAPTAIELAGFTLAYLVLPHRTVSLRHAFAGGVLATVLFELAKFGFALYLTNASYRQIYGAVAVLPILLIWIYVSWVVVLLGASFAASLSAFRFQPAALRLPEGYEMYGLLRLLGRFEEAQLQGRAMHSEELLDLEPCLTDGLLQEFLGELARMGVLRRAEDGGWLLARDLGKLSLDDLYEGAGLRVPVSEAVLPCREDALGQRALSALDELRLPLREHLKRKIGTIYRD